MKRNKQKNQANSNKEEFGNEIEITSNKRRNSDRSNESVNPDNYNYEFGTERYNQDLNYNEDYNLRFTNPTLYDSNRFNTEFSTEFDECCEDKEHRSPKKTTTENSSVTEADKTSKKPRNSLK